MNRADLIETVALGYLDLDEWPEEWPEGGEAREYYLSRFAKALDRALPQITTAEQLEALHPATWLLGQTLPGRPELWERGSMAPVQFARYLRDFGPFVVWQPQDQP